MQDLTKFISISICLPDEGITVETSDGEDSQRMYCVMSGGLDWFTDNEDVKPKFKPKYWKPLPSQVLKIISSSSAVGNIYYDSEGIQYN